MNIPTTQTGALDALSRRTLSHHKARAKAVGQHLDYTADDLRKLIDSSPTCRWCKLPVSFGDLQLDHLQPIARGGKWTLYNLCIADSRCNRLRGQLTEAETQHLLEFLNDLHPSAREDIERRLLSGGKVYASRKATPAPISTADKVAWHRAEVELARARLADGKRRTDG